MPVPMDDNMLLCYEHLSDDESSSDMSIAMEKSDEKSEKKRVHYDTGLEPEEPVTPRVSTCTECHRHYDEHEDNCPVWMQQEEEAWARNEMKHRNAAKAPMSGIMPVEDEFEDDGDDMDQDDDNLENMVIPPPVMDLRWFFSLYNIDAHSQIAVCRTHANNLAAVSRATTKPETKKTKISK